MWPGGMESVDSEPVCEPVFGTGFGEELTIGPDPEGRATVRFGSAAMWPGGMEPVDSDPASEPVFGMTPEGDVTIGPGPVARPGLRS